MTKHLYSIGSELEVAPESLEKQKSKPLLVGHIVSQQLWSTYCVPGVLRRMPYILASPYLILRESF